MSPGAWAEKEERKRRELVLRHGRGTITLEKNRVSTKKKNTNPRDLFKGKSLRPEEKRGREIHQAMPVPVAKTQFGAGGGILGKRKKGKKARREESPECACGKRRGHRARGEPPLEVDAPKKGRIENVMGEGRQCTISEEGGVHSFVSGGGKRAFRGKKRKQKEKVY